MCNKTLKLFKLQRIEKRPALYRTSFYDQLNIKLHLSIVKTSFFSNSSTENIFLIKIYFCFIYYIVHKTLFIIKKYLC